MRKIGDREPRSQGTKSALLAAFGKLVLERAYDEIRVVDLLEGADVGRSTFYEHFRNKDDVLRQSVSGLLAVLARTVNGGADGGHLEGVLDHFWVNRRLARGLLRGSAAPHVSRVLRELIEERICGDGRRSATASLPLRLVASQLAAAQLGLLRAWLDEEARCPPSVLASALRETTRGLLEATLRR